MGICSLALAVAGGPAAAQDSSKTSYPNRAPIEQYRIPNRSEEIALARSAAPASISADAEVMVLGDRGFETAVKGKNGFVCLVERSWFASFDDPVFWNPKIRGPDCLNSAAASSVLPANLEKTQWVLAGLTKAEMIARTKSSTAAQQQPATGSIGYMLSKQGYLSDTESHHWHPHLMFFQPHTALSAWGANLAGSPVFANQGRESEATIFVVPLSTWSDGSSASMEMK
jgi:hypothetical protein